VQRIQNGSIGITLNFIWCEPLSENKLDRQATERVIDFMFGWYPSVSLSLKFMLEVSHRLEIRQFYNI